MKRRIDATLITATRAPFLLGALLLPLFILLSGCKEKETIPEWEDAQPPVPSTVPATPEPVEPESAEENKSEPVEAPTPGEEPASGEEVTSDPETEEDESQLRFVSYNLKNYLGMVRYVDGKRTERFKPDDEIEALVAIITRADPDVLGVSEIGTYDDLVHLQKRLKDAGLDLPHLEHTGGADETRHLGILSRLPIVNRHTPSRDELSYSVQGQDMVMSRGILDTTIEAGDKKFRFLGVHLKSKREIPEADQELMRRNEAYLLRKRADAIMEENPEALIVAYGDFNDTRRNTAIRSVQGAYNTPTYLEAIHHPDSRDLVWTHYWDYQHIYSRFDYVFVSKAARSLVKNGQCRILDDTEWKTASDHRALLTVFDW